MVDPSLQEEGGEKENKQIKSKVSSILFPTYSEYRRYSDEYYLR